MGYYTRCKAYAEPLKFIVAQYVNIFSVNAHDFDYNIISFSTRLDASIIFNIYRGTTTNYTNPTKPIEIGVVRLDNIIY